MVGIGALDDQCMSADFACCASGKSRDGRRSPFGRSAIQGEIAALASYRIAACQHEREGAFRLIYDCYRRIGITPANRQGMRVTPHHLLESTEVFVASIRGRIACTLTLVPDGPLGLPSEEAYAEEIAAFRAAGSRLAEASSLAIRPGQGSTSVPVFVRLTQLLLTRCRMQGVEELIITVHPRHACFYERAFRFRSFGPPRLHPGVSHSPAVALRLHFGELRAEEPRLYSFLFGFPWSYNALRGAPMSWAEQAYFGPIARLASLASSPGWMSKTRVEPSGHRFRRAAA